MEYDLQVTTHVTENLYQHLNAATYILFQKSKLKRYILFTGVLFFLYTLGIYWIYKDVLLTTIIGCFLVIALIVMYCLRANVKFVSKRNAKRCQKYSKNPFPRIRYTFYPDCMYIETPTNRVKTNYNTIIELAETKEYFMLYVTRVGAHTIKKSNLGPSNLDLFREYMETKTGITCKQINYSS